MFRRNQHPYTAYSGLYNEQTFFTAFSKDMPASKEELIIESPMMSVLKLWWWLWGRGN